MGQLQPPGQKTRGRNSTFLPQASKKWSSLETHSLFTLWVELCLKWIQRWRSRWWKKSLHRRYCLPFIKSPLLLCHLSSSISNTGLITPSESHQHYHLLCVHNGGAYVDLCAAQGRGHMTQHGWRAAAKRPGVLMFNRLMYALLDFFFFFTFANLVTRTRFCLRICKSV